MKRVVGGMCVVVLVVLVMAIQFAIPQSALAQTNVDEQVKKLAPVLVTGSLIPTAETIGATPVDVVTAEDIQKVGSTDLISTLKKLNVNFAGNGTVGTEVNNSSYYGESHITLRNLGTLVLLNGKRLGNSTFSNGAYVDVSSIPLAAVDRIEILKDGASAIYGSEAVGGVVNIITKKDYEGVEVSGRFGTATGKGNYYEEGASVVVGQTTEKSTFMASAQWYHNNPLLVRDRNLALSTAELVARNIDPGYGGYLSPTFPGEAQDDTGRYVLRGSPLLRLFNPAEYDATFTTPPIVEGFVRTPGSGTAVQDYNAAYVAAHPGSATPYVLALDADGNDLFINTANDFGVQSIQKSERKTFFGSGSYDLHGKMAQLYGELLYANVENVSNLGPSPMISLAPAFGNLLIPANNPYNPFGVDLGPGAELGDPRIRSRFVDFGNRIFDAQTDYYHFVGGLKGEFDNGVTYNAAYTYNRYDQLESTRNAVNASALGLAVIPNSDTNLAAQGLSQLQDVSGAYVPIYNVFGVGGQNSQRTIDALRATLFTSGNSVDWTADAVITAQPFDLRAGKVGIAAGGGFNSASLSIDYDGLTKTAKAPGLNPQLPTSGTRNSWAGFVEVRLPITSPDMDLPIMRSLEITAAGRYETFDPGGDSAVPKVTVRWQPIDEQATIRASYSKSFIAPSTYELFGGDQQTANSYELPDVVGNRQEASTFASNPFLKPVDAENWGVGIVLSPKIIKGLTVSVDYYHIQTFNDIFNADGQTMVDSLNALGSASPYAPFYQRADGSHLTTTDPNQVTDADWGLLRLPSLNGASQETEGLDLSATYMVPTDSMGTFGFYANANVLFKYDYSDPISGSFQYRGTYTDQFQGVPGAQGTLPDYIINTGMTWEKPVGADAFTIGVNAKYIPTVDDIFPGTLDGSPWTVEDWFQIDMQVGYEIGKNRSQGRHWFDNTRILVGVNNITDEAPPLISSSAEDITDKSTYDVIGRFVYFEISKKF